MSIYSQVMNKCQMRLGVHKHNRHLLARTERYQIRHQCSINFVQTNVRINTLCPSITRSRI